MVKKSYKGLKKVKKKHHQTLILILQFETNPRFITQLVVGMAFKITCDSFASFFFRYSDNELIIIINTFLKPLSILFHLPPS